MKILFTTLLLLGNFSYGAVCKGTNNGITVTTTPLKVGATRVPGNVMVYITDDEDGLVASFSGQAKYPGQVPDEDTDEYTIKTVFDNALGVKSFTWTHNTWECLRCWPDDTLRVINNVKIETATGQLFFNCQ